MKMRTVLTALALALLAACGGNTPTGTRAPDSATFDGAPADSGKAIGGSFGPGH